MKNNFFFQFQRLFKLFMIVTKRKILIKKKVNSYIGAYVTQLEFDHRPDDSVETLVKATILLEKLKGVLSSDPGISDISMKVNY